MTKYKIIETDADLPLMSRTLGISEITARVIANRGIRSKKTALAYLKPELLNLQSPILMKDMEKCAGIIRDAISCGGKIIIYGDYDADGVMGTVILLKTLRKLGADADYYIPHRSEEGYGLNLNAVRRIAEEGASLLLTVDNGISALKEIEEAKRLGLTVAVIDHHEPGFKDEDGKRTDIIPEADTVVDPKQSECEYPFKAFCAAGLAYKLAVFLDAADDETLVLAAIATLCDIVELTGENRALVKRGLDVLNRNKLINPGLGSLITRRGYLDKTLDEFAVGFVIGPCINATGRLESADISVQLLLADDPAERFQLAEKLTRLNDERKSLTQETVSRALEKLQAGGKPDKILVIVDTEAHESVAGIVAGRVRDAVNRPTLLFTRGDNAMKGSGRSVEGYNLFEGLFANRHLFLRFGGHAMAAGLTLPEENIDPLRLALNEACALSDEDFIPVLAVDCILDADDVTLALSNELAFLAPFGKGNREPLFAGFGLPLESVRIIDEKRTLIFTFICKNKRRVKGIAFGMNDRFREIYGGFTPGMTVDAAFSVETNVYNGVASPQMRINAFLT